LKIGGRIGSADGTFWSGLIYIDDIFATNRVP
jgi:hypothetical protein